MPPLWNKGKLKETSYTRQSGNWLVTNRQTNKDRTDYMLPPFKWKITRKGFSAEPQTLDTMGHRIFFLNVLISEVYRCPSNFFIQFFKSPSMRANIQSKWNQSGRNWQNEQKWRITKLKPWRLLPAALHWGPPAVWWACIHPSGRCKGQICDRTPWLNESWPTL